MGNSYCIETLFVMVSMVTLKLLKRFKNTLKNYSKGKVNVVETTQIRL